MRNQIKISVILPVYNVASFLKRSVDSLIHQKFKDYEIILVDDESTDGSNIILDDYQKRFKNIKVIYQKNAGSGAARNKGLEIARGEYVYFMDPDDWLEENMLSENYALVNERQPDMLIFGWYDHIGEKVSSTEFEDRYISNKEEFIRTFPEMFKKNLLYTVWNKLYKRKFLTENNLIFGHERNGQDYLFNIKVYDVLTSVLLNNTRYYHYIMKRKNAATTKFNSEIFSLYKKEQIELMNFMNKHSIYEEGIISDRWWFILISTWKRSVSQEASIDTNKYMEKILDEYVKNKYIDINKLSRFKTKIGYIFFFRTGIYKYFSFFKYL